MLINGREVGFLWNVGALCEYSDWMVSLNGREVSLTTGILHKAIAMNRAYMKANNIPEGLLTIAELEALPITAFKTLTAEVDKAEKEGSKRTVEAEDTGKKEASTKK